MAWVEERQTVNMRVQIGAEATTALGTLVAASKLLECFDFTFTITTDLATYTPTGHKYPNIQEENEEWVEIAMSGNLDYNGVIYPLASICGATTPVAHLASVTAKDWIFTPPVTGSIVPQTYTLEQGDAVRAHRATYGLFTDFSYKGTRKDFTCAGKMMAQALLDAITLTPTPTVVLPAPVIARNVNVYLDTTAAGLGTTLLTRFFSVEFDMSGVYQPMWVLNRANVSYTAHVDVAPKAQVKFLLEADAAGMALLPLLQAGTTMFLRVDALGTNIIAADGPGSIFPEFRHDMAIKIGKPSAFSDSGGVFAVEYDCPIVEDFTWNKSQLFTVTNLLATL